jgi:MFS transporter, DHA2 family, multidrug resistance protein
VRDQHCVGWDAVSFNLKETKPDRPAHLRLLARRDFGFGSLANFLLGIALYGTTYGADKRTR